MIAELIYTSAPRTLDGPGYGVVARSEDLPERLEKFMRRMNRYDFDLPAERGASTGGPVVFSHTTLRDGPATWHVMSRVAGAGRDYTQRAVFLAHHVAVTGDELRGASVADLIQEPALFESDWRGTPGFIPTRPLPLPARRKPARGAWSSLAGHRDWAKVWVDRWAQHGGRSSFVIVPEGADVMALFVEAMALLPAEEAGNVTFITGLNADRAGEPFDWIGLTAGSEMAHSIQQRFPDRTLDLTRPLGSVPSSASTARPASPSGAGSDRMINMRDPSESAPDDDDLEEEARDEPKRRPKDAPARRRPAPAAAPPPPPPPRRFTGRHAAAIAIAAGIVLAAMAWRLWPSGNGPPMANNSQPPTGPRPEDVPDVNRPAIARGNGAEGGGLAPAAGVGVEPGGVGPRPSRGGGGEPIREGQDDQNGGKPHPLALNGSPPSREPRVVHLKGGWLSDLLKEKTETQVELSDQVPIPASYTLKLRSAGELGLKSDPLSEYPAARDIEVYSSDEPAGKARARDGSVRIGLKGNKLEFRRSEPRGSKTGDDVVDRLPFCVLDIIPGPQDRPVSEPPIRVVLTPILPPLPFTYPEVKSPEWEGAAAYIAAAHRFEDAVNAKVRVDRVTLSILPPGNPGWPSVNPRAEVRIGSPWDNDLKVEWPGGQKWQARVTVFPEARGSLGRSVVRLEPLDSAGQDADAEKEDPDDKATGPAPTEPGAPALKGRAPKDSPREPRPKASKGVRSHGASEKAKGTPAAEDESSPERLRKARHGALVTELFQRYGLVHGSIVIRIKDEEADRRVEGLRFGGEASNPHP